MNPEYLVIPPTLKRLMITRPMLERTRVLLARPGEQGLEAAVLWLGLVVSTIEARVDAVLFPRQIAYRTDEGLAVEIPVEEWTGIALRLPPGYFVLAKLHTHSADAYHSDMDAANPYMRHEGAFAITVPCFARCPFDTFEGWSVNIFCQQQWARIDRSEFAQTIVVEQAYS
jgi:hypothetical protein